VAATAAFLVPRGGDEDASGGAASAPSAPVTTREVTAAPSTAKGISVREGNIPLLTAPGGTASATARGEATLRPRARAANPVTTARVVHQHRLGGCRGVLTASTQGLAFEPQGPSSDDAFRMAYRDFVHNFDGETLVLKTGDRTFRFQSINTDGKGHCGELSALLAP
jgi:hypothetical protein